MAHNRVFFLQDSLRASSHPLTPPLPPPPPPAPPAHTSSSSSFPILAISILGILTTAILLVSYYVFVIKCCLNWRQTDIFGRLSAAAAAGASNHRARLRSRRRGAAIDDAFFATFYAPPSASPARGLEEWAIRSIPIVRFKRSPSICSSGEKGGSLCECAVCLGEFQEGEGLRQLPGCSHVFHIDCIDVWLQNSTNCPLCRSDVSVAAPPFHLVPPIHHSLTHFPAPVQDHNGDVVIDFGGRPGGEPNSAATAATATATAAPSPMPLASEHQNGAASKKGGGHRKLQHVSSMGDECINVRRPWGKDGDFGRFALSPVQPMRRSISMDSSTDHHLYVAVQEILRQQRQQVDSSGEGTSRSAAPAAGGSGRIRRSFFSFGHCRSSRSAVLPIQFDP